MVFFFFLKRRSIINISTILRDKQINLSISINKVLTDIQIGITLQLQSQITICTTDKIQSVFLVRTLFEILNFENKNGLKQGLILMFFF